MVARGSTLPNARPGVRLQKRDPTRATCNTKLPNIRVPFFDMAVLYGSWVSGACKDLVCSRGLVVVQNPPIYYFTGLRRDPHIWVYAGVWQVQC